MEQQFMREMDETILSSISIIAALVGLYFVVRVWLKWKDIDIDVIKARAFLDKKFLEMNWKYIFLTGASLTAHQFLEMLLQKKYIVSGFVSGLSEILEFMALVFLVILAYEWFMILYKK